MKRLSLIICSAVLTAGTAAVAAPSFVSAATEHFNDASAESTAWNNWKQNWEQISSNYENVSLTPGKTESELNYAWYSKTAETPKVRLSTSASMTGAKEFTGAQTAITDIEKLNGYYSNKVTVTGLQENTAYYYQVFQDGKWQDTQKYATKSFKSFSFLYAGDPQIGASKNQTDSEGTALSDKDSDLAARNDSYNWDKTLNNALAAHPDVSFLVSAGDQVNAATNELEYAGYLHPDALKSLPVATTIGNHDSTSDQYTYHYNNPNSFDASAASDKEYTEGKTAAGTDYYYTYGNVLFIVLDTNNYNCATHENVIKKAIAENPDTRWRVVTFHQDIYGSGYDHSDSDGIILRTQLTPLMDKYDIDVVMQGHDHTYSRTYQLTGDGGQHTAYNKENYKGKDDQTFQNQNLCYAIKSGQASGTVTNPEGTVYLEANSATGSKFYNLIASQQDYISERSQTWTPSYSVVTVDDNSFSVTTYDATTNAQLGGSSTYTIRKTSTPDQPDTLAKPSKVTGVKASSAKKSQITASWKKAKNAVSYKLQVSTDKSFAKSVKTYSTKSLKKTVKNLSSGKTYYVRVAAVNTAGSQSTQGSYSKTVLVKSK